MFSVLLIAIFKIFNTKRIGITTMMVLVLGKCIVKWYIALFILNYISASNPIKHEGSTVLRQSFMGSLL